MLLIYCFLFVYKIITDNFDALKSPWPKICIYDFFQELKFARIYK
jgi:hypothetical protein